VKILRLTLIAGASVIGLCGCWILETPQPGAQRPAMTPKLEPQRKDFTGKVILVDNAYRVELIKEPGSRMRLTRARRESEFAEQQIYLKKYFEKTIVIRGTRQDDWIWGADIIGQWTKPGESQGPNMNAPKVGNH
jgi:hypothetical protein